MKNLRLHLLALLGSIFFVGTGIWIFMVSLGVVISFFQSHWLSLLWALPFLAMLVAYLETFKNGKRFGDSEKIFQEIKNPQVHVHWLLAPWICLLTLLFHLFGASVGRESTAIQIGASLTESCGRLLRIPPPERPLVVRMGLAAGFGAAFGIPWSGAVFGLESPLLFRKKDWLHLPFYLASSFGAHWWCSLLLGREHSLWQSLKAQAMDVAPWSYLLALGFLVLGCFLYELSFRSMHLYLQKFRWWIAPGFAGILLILLTLWAGGPRYNNLGVDLIHGSFEQGALLKDALAKLGFTFISIVSGMKGGEVTPLMASGALFGSWLTSLLPGLNFQVGAALGLVSLFSSRLRIPVTATVMLLEIFDWKIALLGLPMLALIEFSQRKVISRLF